MSIATELQDLETYLSNAYDKIQDKGGTIPQNKNMYNLADAINSITQNQPIIIPPSARNTSINRRYDFTYKNNLY